MPLRTRATPEDMTIRIKYVTVTPRVGHDTSLFAQFHNEKLLLLRRYSPRALEAKITLIRQSAPHSIRPVPADKTRESGFVALLSRCCSLILDRQRDIIFLSSRRFGRQQLKRFQR